AGTVVQSLYKLKDHDNTEGGYFIFSDISVRLEGFYRLKFTLYEIEGIYVNRLCSVISDIFQVYSPKSFPGMSESTLLTRSFSDQGVRIRIRKEPRVSSSK
ncbi:velvet factor, partial [Cokeromyces recurvatus]|uniref:velvet factor n=1 Tax=Cokeromyces recurvatus TaxID=90255 RepID=UPI002220D2B9